MALKWEAGGMLQRLGGRSKKEVVMCPLLSERRVWRLAQEEGGTVPAR